MSTQQITPTHCRADAFGLFADQLPELETTSGLLHASIAVEDMTHENFWRQLLR